MKSTVSALTLCAIALLAGCARPAPPTEPPAGPLFCDIEEPRRFSQEEIDWRATHAPWNLRRDLATNETGRARCDW